MHHGAGDEDRAFQGIGAFTGQLPRHRGQQAVGARHRPVPRVHQHETSGAIGVLGHARHDTGLAERGRLLVAGDPGDGDAHAEQPRRRFANDFAARMDLRQQAARDVYCAQQLVVPSAGMDVVQQGAAGIGRIGHVQRAAAQVPHQPGVDRAESQFAALGLCARPGNIVEQPGDLGAAEIGVQQKTGLLPDQRLMAFGEQAVADARRAPVLPDDGVVDRPAGLAIPNDGRFALVGDAYGGDVAGAQAGRGYGFLGDTELGRPDIARVVLDPAGLRKDLAEFALRLAAHPPIAVEDDGAAGRRALIESQDKGCHAPGMTPFVPESNSFSRRS